MDKIIKQPLLLIPWTSNEQYQHTKKIPSITLIKQNYILLLIERKPRMPRIQGIRTVAVVVCRKALITPEILKRNATDL